MVGGLTAWTRKVVNHLAIAVPALAIAVGLLTTSAQAGQTRALKIYHLHTHEKAIIVFKRNGRYDPAGLKKLNYILRDWRRDEPTRMDPRLFDLIWEVYQKSGSHEYINVVCGYRAPETNAMLRSRTRGVAEKSQHMLGKAMDFYLPDVRLSKLREIGMKFQVGGVGFYPTSGSPFVHMDVGNVRAWPRMPRRELARLFPDGRTLHKPLEGGVMPGYAAALADYHRRVDSDSIRVAGNPSSNSDNDTGGTHHKSLLAALFDTHDESEDDMADADIDSTPAKVDRSHKNDQILTAQDDGKADKQDSKDTETAFNAPVPKSRPAYTDDDQPTTLETALLGQKKNPAEEAMQAALTPQPADQANADDNADQPEFADLKSYRVPVPQLLGERKRPGDADDTVMTASLDPKDTAAMAAVPVPDARPEDDTAVKDADQTVTATTTAKADEIKVPAGDIKPAEIAALAAQTSDAAKADATTDEDEADAITDTLDNVDKNDQKSNMAEMASIDVPNDTKSVTRSFVLPANAADQMSDQSADTPKTKPNRKLTAEQIVKHARLSKNMIAQWALAKGRLELVQKPIKTQRVATRIMPSQQPEQRQGNTVQIDPGRF